MKLALLLVWLLTGAVDWGWWDANTSPTDTEDVSKMDGGDEPPPKP